MSSLKNGLLMEVCLELNDYYYIKNLQRFALMGKENFLAYIQLLQSIKSYRVFWDKITVKLSDKDFHSSLIGWNHFYYMCGRYAPILNINSPYIPSEHFICGVKENKHIQEFSINTKSLGKINDAGCQLKLDILICADDNFDEFLRMKNFSTSEIQFTYFPVARFVDKVGQNYTRNKLNPNLKHVKRWVISERNREIGPLYSLLSLLKKISPNMERCTINRDIWDGMSKGDLKQYLTRIHEAISKIEEEWNDTPDRFLYIDYKFVTRLYPDDFLDPKSVKEFLNTFSGYEVKEVLPRNGLKFEISTSKRVSRKIVDPSNLSKRIQSQNLKITSLNNALLVEVCLELIGHYIKDLQRFVLTGKENFLAYVQLFQSIESYEVFWDKITVKLFDRGFHFPLIGWNHFYYMCGRYIPILNLNSYYEYSKYFIRGLKENKHIHTIDISKYCYPEEDLASVIAPLPIKKLFTNIQALKKVNDAGCQLKLDILICTEGCNFDEFLCMKNFSTSEIQFPKLQLIEFVNSVGSAHKKHKLNNDNYSFLNAVSACENSNGSLVSVPNETVNDYLTDQAKQNFTSPRFWIGVYKFPDGWGNIDDYLDITYSNWAPREPANQTEANGCVSVDMKGLWYNDNCSTSYSFICEISEIEATTTQNPSSSSAISAISLTTTTASPLVCKAYIPFNINYYLSAYHFSDILNFIGGQVVNQLFPQDLELAPFMAASDKATYYYPIAQSINDLSNAVIALRIFGDDPPAFNDSLQSILNLGIFNYNDGVPINAVVFTTRDLYAVEVHDVQVLVNQFTVIGGTVTVVLIYSTKNDTTYYEMVNGLNVVLWSNNSIMLSSIRQGFKCEGGTPVFKPCKSWISFALDSSNVLSPTDFQNQLNFVSNAISKMNHAEHVQLVSMNGSIANWYDPYPISYIQSQMNSTTQNGNFSLNASLNAIYSSYIQLTTLPKPPIGALVFVSDTSSPSNYEGADDVVNHLKNNGFKLTFILMGLNVNQTLLKKYTDNFITWTDLSNPQPDNWDNVYLDAYACPK